MSPATVSRVLNGKAWVSEEKRRAVNEWITRLGYKPNQVAQTLVGTRSFLLGVVITDVSNPFFADIVKLLQQEAFLSGYAIVLCHTNAAEDIERQQVDSLIRRQVDGVVIVPCRAESPGIRKLRQAEIPTVVVTQQHPELDSVCVDHNAGGAMVAAHLLSAGHTRLAYFGKKQDAKFNGFRREAAANGVSPDRIPCVKVDYDSVETIDVESTVRRFFDSEEGRQTPGVFALNDFVALAALNTAAEYRRRTPGDLSVVGFDNTYLARIHRPSLTSVAQPLQEMAHRAIELLRRRLAGQGDNEPNLTLLQPRVVVRRSSSREAGTDSEYSLEDTAELPNGATRSTGEGN